MRDDFATLARAGPIFATTRMSERTARNLSVISRSPKIDVAIDVVSRYVETWNKDGGKMNENNNRDHAIYKALRRRS